MPKRFALYYAPATTDLLWSRAALGAPFTVTRNPAKAAMLEDRGEIAEGKRADLVRVHVEGGMPIVRAVYRQGRRVS